MGKILLYNAGRALQSLGCSLPTTTGGYQTNTYQDTSGNSYTTLWYYLTKYNNTQFNNSVAAVKKQTAWINGMTGHISADTEADFDLDDYTANAIADVSAITSGETSTVNGKTYTIVATNNGASEVSVGSIKFTNGVYAPAGETDTPTAQTCLMCGYFLDNPVTLGVGETKTFAVNFDFWNY